MKKLDLRAKKASNNCQIKPRVVSSPSTSTAPDGAPEWAVCDFGPSARENENASQCINIGSARRTLDYQDSELIQ